MPQYELSVIFKALGRMDLSKAIKRTSETILNSGGVIRSFDNVGLRKLPYKMFKHGNRYDEGNYYIIKFDCPPNIVPDLKAHFNLDLDIVRPKILRQEKEISRPCHHRPCDFGEMNIDMRERLKDDLNKYIKKL
ncbi:hypothetical protein HELRODRAFT_62093 [Helobdella robusta]|uniref:Small ribosomal subunit protein bS6m n=1 Tax=Helobdella robusta TaxID=6412 RepID=T1FWV6_HELRO|nr:hypothetical protein HELRODRAFT_62093 [Helobdella robusta]ESO12414.1 hypothetical protein HELRODRAFT_62093 [Helobdella robusta]